MGRWPGHKFAAGLAAAVLLVWLGAMAVMVRTAALPPEASGLMLAVFEPGQSAEDVFARIIRAGGRPVRATYFNAIWVVGGDESGLAGRLEREGAIGTYKELPVSPSLAGCFAYAGAKIGEIFTIRP